MHGICEGISTHFVLSGTYIYTRHIPRHILHLAVAILAQDGFIRGRMSDDCAATLDELRPLVQGCTDDVLKGLVFIVVGEALSGEMPAGSFL